MGKNCREIGSRAVISVRTIPGMKLTMYGIYHGDDRFSRQIGDGNLADFEWYSEVEAQAFLDRMARVCGWRPVK